MIAADARSGSTVGKYRLHEIVGRGGMGVVYRAEHVYIGREVAVKILHEGYGAREDSIKRFLREARAASLINHPNIVEVTDFGKATDGTVFFVMELLVGEPLDALLGRERRLDLLRAITICNQLAAALAAAHSKGIIHRDLKPENVMLLPRAGRRELVRRVNDDSGRHETSERETRFDFVKILDFGVAKVREPEAQKRVTQAGVVFGTPEYMAPETARIGFSDARSDIYALGVMFFEMLTGVVPFTGDAPVDVMMKQVNERVPRMHDVAREAEITDETEKMIQKALAKDPDHRQQSMEEFHRDLQKCYGQLRFRRTLKTPTVNTPPIEVIALTKKKAVAPGAMPTNLSSGRSVPIDLAPEGSERKTPTPNAAAGGTTPIPAASATTPIPAAGSADAPILLTKKKAPRREIGAEPIALLPTTPPLEVAASPTRNEKKRTTLPLGIGNPADIPGRVSSTMPAVSATPVMGAAVVARLANPAANAAANAADRPTPRVPMRSPGSPPASTDGSEAEQGWSDDPTVPGASGDGTR